MLQMSVMPEIMIPNIHAYRRAVKKPAATQNQMSIMRPDQRNWPHWMLGNADLLARGT